VAILPCLFQIPTGAINGVNRVFATQGPYLLGSTQVFLNGQAKVAAFADGWVELGGNRISMKVAPETGDILQVYYQPTY
jgi:hypothetical protein